MKILLIGLISVLFYAEGIIGQDCFMPPDGDTLYSTTNVIYNPPSITGFVSLGPTLSGDWSLIGTSGGAGAIFTDDDGRTSTLSITGTGTLSFENISTDINTNDKDTCQHTFVVENYAPTIVSNPSRPATCPINLTLVLDESESIEANMSIQTVRDAVMALVHGLENSGSTLALVEFDTEAERIPLNGSVELQDIDAALLTALDNYLISGYNPIGDVTNLIGGTNWEDALTKANSVVGTDFVLMVTDGRPTFYSTSMGMNGVAGEGLVFDVTALKQANDVANILKSSGKRIFIAGLDFPSDVQPIIDISGTSEYLIGQNIDQLFISDFTRVPPSQLVPLFTRLGDSCNIEIVPTMGEWAIINVALLMLILGVVALKSQNVINYKSEV